MPLATIESHVQMPEKSLFTEIQRKEEQLELAKKARNGDKEACARLVLSMTKLILKRIFVKIQTFNDEETIADLLHDCYLVLLRVFYDSSAKFDSTKGSKPSTYAVWWIDDTIGRKLHDISSPIRLPQNIKWSIVKFAREHPDARLNSNTEIAIVDFARKNKINPKTLIAALGVFDVLSLDTPIKSDPDETAEVNGIIDETFSPEKVVGEEIRNSSIRRLISEAMVLGLSQREAAVLRARYGMNPSREEQGFEEIGRQHGISGERARQIEKESLEKIRMWLEAHPKYSRLLGQLEAATCS
ncbi:MAG: sigma-70 family RNA polymerase sigma factor [Candidatus Paceibacterota bacterium]|jgi:RNA polymerase sigma factor (sigma-70 family)